jgi:acyl transferase domain-containing protein
VPTERGERELSELLQDHPDAVAIIGVGCRFADVDGPEQLWRALRAGRDLTGPLPGGTVRPGWVPVGGVLRDADHFDAHLFGVPPREAEITDPQQRVFLEVCWQALEHAAHSAESFRGEIGVYASSGTNVYLPRLRAAGLADVVNPAVLEHGNEKDFLAAKVSYRLGLRGPSVVVQTACSSALAAVHLARQSLASFECDLALAGGSSVSLDRVLGYPLSADGLLSAGGRCRPFDRHADGMVPSDGVAVVVLRRLEDAVQDGDQIMAVVLGSGLSNDGRDRSGFGALGVDGLVAAQRAAYAAAGVDPSTIDFVEPHGTGTQAGDPVEFAALREVIGQAPNRSRPCRIGGVKGALGHTDATSGVTSLIVAVLCLQQRTMLPAVHHRDVNPHLRLAGSGLEILSEPVAWSAGDGPRRAAVSAVGIGGTSVHVILQQAPARAELSPADPAPLPHLVPLSAASLPALRRAADRLAASISAEARVCLADIAHTMRRGRTSLRYRWALVADDTAELSRLLVASPPVPASADVGRDAIGFVVGGGSIPAGVTRDLLAIPGYRRHLSAVAATLADALTPGALRWASGEPDDRTARDLSAGFLGRLAMAELLADVGVRPEQIVSDGTGDYLAAVLAGVCTTRDAVSMVVAHARYHDGSGDADAFRRACLQVTMRRPTLPVRDGATGALVCPEAFTTSGYWLSKLDRPVSSPAGTAVGGRLVDLSFNDPRGQRSAPRALLEFLAEYWSEGGSARWGALELPGRAIHLPGYPFERVRYNPLPDAAEAAQHPAPADRVPPGHPRSSDLPTPAAPATPMEAQLCLIWSEVLGIDPIGATDDFLELGGDSLAWQQIMSRTHTRYGGTLTFGDMFRYPTIRALAERLTQADRGDPQPITRAPRLTVANRESGVTGHA